MPRTVTTEARLREAARRVRAEERRIADVGHDLRHAVHTRVWSGPASERFARSVGRRLRELDTQEAALRYLAGRLDATADTAADAARDASRAAATAPTPSPSSRRPGAVVVGRSGISGGGEG